MWNLLIQTATQQSFSCAYSDILSKGGLSFLIWWNFILSLHAIPSDIQNVAAVIKKPSEYDEGDEDEGPEKCLAFSWILH